MFNDIKTDDSIKPTGDTLGGTRTQETGIYELTVKLAYGSLSRNKASALNLVLETPEGTEVKQQLWVTSGEAKGCLPYYINSKTKVKKFLPGYETANDLCWMTLNKPLNQTTSENKTIMLYDFSQGSEVPTEVKMITELIGKKIYAGLIKQTVDKNVLDPGTNTYLPSGETREENEIDKFFHYPSGLTIIEAKAKVTEPKFKESWEKKWTGVTRDKTTKISTIPGAPLANTQNNLTSMFA